MSTIVVFDLDGVITSERAYWDTAGLVIHELLFSPRYWNTAATTLPYQPVITREESLRVSNEVFPQEAMMRLKARALNSNWDTCFMGVSLYLIALLAQIPDRSSLFPLQPENPSWMNLLHKLFVQTSEREKLSAHIFAQLDAPAFQGASGLELLHRLDLHASAVLGQPVEGVFVHYGAFWLFCQNLFQEWYLGEEIYTRTYHRAPLQTGKSGCIHFERPLLPLEAIHTALATLREQGYTLGIATGRNWQESTTPLKNYALYQYFDEQRIATYDQAAEAERELRVAGDRTALVKPHPYQFLRAADPSYRVQPNEPLAPSRTRFIVVGDTPSDVRGAHAAGALIIAVLTGALTAEARTLLEASGPDFLVDDMTQIPALLAQLDDLGTIQQLQFTERAKAEALLQNWFARHLHLETERVTLTPKPVSLNSFNGIYRVDGEDYFFKTHVEEQGILEEYYHAELLHQAGYRIVRPLRTVHEKGQQMVIYPVVHAPVMFDLMRAVEREETAQATEEILIAAEQRECERLLQLYQDQLQFSTAQEHAQAPIHQLFWHRLTGGRLASFYDGKSLVLPDENQQPIPFEVLSRYRWVINGEPVVGKWPTIESLIQQAKTTLHPARAMMTVIGHGDAHFGNVFLFEQQHYCYFDPAFAGRHSPLLDLVKPFFHNIYATWMYFPQEVAQWLRLTVTLQGEYVQINHNYELTSPRKALLQTKLQSLLIPLKRMLRERAALPDDGDDIVRLALMCCPLLTINLLRHERIPPVISWLALSQVIQMGNLALPGD